MRASACPMGWRQAVQNGQQRTRPELALTCELMVR